MVDTQASDVNYVLLALVYRHCGEADDEIKGGDNKLDVVIASYKPNVRCNSFPGPLLASCISIFSGMHVDKWRHMFGHKPDPRAEVQSPITYTSGEVLQPLYYVVCLLTIYSGSKVLDED